MCAFFWCYAYDCDIFARMLSVTELPDDPMLLKRMLVERDAEVRQRNAAIFECEAMIEQIKREAAERIEALQQQHQAELEALLRRFYGPRSERFDPRQLLLFGLTIDNLAAQISTQADPDHPASAADAVNRQPRRHNHGRGPLPASLRRIIIPHDLSDKEKKCPCCGEVRCRIGEDRTEQIERMPAEFVVLVHVQSKYACPHCEKNGENPQIEVAPKPLQPIHRGLPGPILLAFIIVSKFADHVPLYRLEQIFGREGVELSRGTMCGWLLAVAQVVKPLYELIGQRIRQSEKIHTDDTRLPVQDKPAKPGPAPPAPLPPATTTGPALPGPSIPTTTLDPTLSLLPAVPRDPSSDPTAPMPSLALATTLPASPPPAGGAPALPAMVPVEPEGRCPAGRMWVFLGDAGHPYTLFAYTPDRTRQGPDQWLQGFSKYLQADAFSGYDGIYARGVIEVGCWAHARRHVFDARNSDGRRSAQMLAMIGQLYAVEREAKEANSGQGLDEAGVLALRQEKSVPVLAKIRNWLDREIRLVLPRSPMAGAINYILNQWDALCVYTTRGFLDIDNNAAEREMKKIATGRKNWLFCGTEEGARAAAMLYTLVASARRHGLDPLAYLADVLAKLPATPVSQVGRFLPDEWKRERAEAGQGSVSPEPGIQAMPVPITGAAAA